MGEDNLFMQDEMEVVGYRNGEENKDAQNSCAEVILGACTEKANFFHKTADREHRRTPF